MTSLIDASEEEKCDEKFSVNNMDVEDCSAKEKALLNKRTHKN
jgi:hypothetical protein